MVFVVRDGKLGQQRIAVVTMVVNRIATILKLAPDAVSEEFVMWRLRKVGHPVGMLDVGALDFLQKNHVCRHFANGVTQVMQHEAAVERAEPFVDVDCQDLE